MANLFNVIKLLKISTPKESIKTKENCSIINMKNILSIKGEEYGR